MLLILLCTVCVSGIQAAPAAAITPLGAVCGVASLTSGLLGKACTLVSKGGDVVSAGRQLLGGHIGSAVKTFLGQAGGAVSSRAKEALTLAAIGAWVLGGARFALHETAKVLSETTTPRLGTTWFSTAYWRVGGIAALLTLPFLFAAAIQALVRSDLSLLLRAVLGYLPLAILVVSIAAPLTMLLLSASDELSGLVSSAAGHPGSRALALGGVLAGGLSALTGSPFLIFFLGLLTVAGAMTLWMELLMREAAVYVVVLMLPLAFAAMVWPARRMWAIRSVELLVALILSKFAIVAVLSLGGAAMDQVGHSFTAPIVGLVLVMMGAFAPWALLRLVPLAELGASAVESLRGQGGRLAAHANESFAVGQASENWASTTTAEMRRAAEETTPSTSSRAPGELASTPSDTPAGIAEQELAADAAITGTTAGESTVSLETTTTDAGDLGRDRTNTSRGPGVGANAQPDAEPGERLPGLPEIWQADDLTWQPLILGSEEDWPPHIWPADDVGEIEGLPEDEAKGLASPETPYEPGPAEMPTPTDPPLDLD